MKHTNDKKTYERASLRAITFAASDIITTSDFKNPLVTEEEIFNPTSAIFG